MRIRHIQYDIPESKKDGKKGGVEGDGEAEKFGKSEAEEEDKAPEPEAAEGEGEAEGQKMGKSKVDVNGETYRAIPLKIFNRGRRRKAKAYG